MPWKPAIQKQVDHWTAEEQAGRPKGLLIDCLPHGTPTFILITHNALEILFSPGRVTILGDSDEKGGGFRKATLIDTGQVLQARLIDIEKKGP